MCGSLSMLWAASCNAVLRDSLAGARLRAPLHHLTRRCTIARTATPPRNSRTAPAQAQMGPELLRRVGGLSGACNAKWRERRRAPGQAPLGQAQQVPAAPQPRPVRVLC